MKKLIPLRQALETPDLLGHALGGETWLAWRSLLIGMAGEPLTIDELEIFRRLTKRDAPPDTFAEECLVVGGRRAGKTAAMSSLAVYLASMCDWTERLKPGERGLVLLIAADMRQARVALDYAIGTMQASTALAPLVGSTTTDTLSLTNGIDLEVRAASFRRLRGVTSVAVLADETAYWATDEASSNPDTEILNAARPTLATTGGPLIMITSPYARRGETWELYRKHFGPEGDPAILVAQAASRDLNPSLPQRVVDRALERDRAAASAEYLGQFRSDVEAFIQLEAVEACVEFGVYERPRLPGVTYAGALDAAGGSGRDSMTLAIAHHDRRTGVATLDLVREVRPPFSPSAVCAEFAETLKGYGVRRVIADRFAGAFPVESMGAHGIVVEQSARPKSQVYADLLPMVNSKRCELLDNQRLISQLVGLERRTSRSGRDSIQEPPNSHDDLINAAALVLVNIGVMRRQGISMVDYL